jgi:dTDP-4-dehydrorhamnose reductase
MSGILLIGSRGTLGSEFTKLISKQNIVLADRPNFDVTNFTSTTNFIRRHNFEVVINCSAYTNVDGAETDYDSAKLVNVDAVKNLARVCKQSGSTLIHYSSGMVFDGTNPAGYNEDSLPQPINKYGKSKLLGEKAIEETKGKYFIIRTEWLYGKPATTSAKKSFIDLMIELGKSGKVQGVTDEVGKPTWAKDLAQATLSLISSKQPTGIYHLINEGWASRLDWAKEIFKIMNMQVECQAIQGSSLKRAAPRPNYELLNNTKLPKMRSWQSALQDYLTTLTTKI